MASLSKVKRLKSLIAMWQVDYFGVELVGGSLFIHMNLGSGPIRIQAARTKTLSDTEWHKVGIYR
jgi:hypothetical protein